MAPETMAFVLRRALRAPRLPLTTFEEKTMSEVMSKLRTDQASEIEAPRVADWDEDDGNDGSEVPQERGGPRGLEPTRYGDWERKGRCTDFS